MKDNIFKYYKLIGEVNAALSKADNYDEAIRASLKFYMEKIPCELAVLWNIDEKGEKLSPVYWLGNRDITSITNRVDEHGLGQCYSEQKAFRDTEKNNVLIPFSSEQARYGCIELVGNDEYHLENEDADVAELIALLITSLIEEQELEPYSWPYTEVLLSAENIKKTYGDGDLRTDVLKGISLNVYKGEFLILLGESGCGKSTMLNIIGGMDRATDGHFSFMGKALEMASDDELTRYRRYNIGFIFQQYNLMPNLTAIQNLDIIGELVDDPMDAEDAIKMVGLYDRKDNYPSQLSGGQQQRVSIARSLIKKPQIIFADEPTAALDYDTSIEVLSVIEDIVATGTTLVMVTHNEEITKMADRVIRIRDGKLYETTINRHKLKASELVW